MSPAVIEFLLPVVTVVTVMHGPTWLAASLGALLLVLGALGCLVVGVYACGGLDRPPSKPERAWVTWVCLAVDLLLVVMLAGAVTRLPDPGLRAMAPAGLLLIGLAQFLAQLALRRGYIR